MPRKKKTIIEEQIPDNAIVTEDGETVSLDSGIEGMFDAIGEQPFLVKVYRITPTGSSFVFCTQERPNQEFESLIQDRCPTGGKFAIRTYINNRIVEPTRHVEIEPRQLTNTATANPLESIQSVQIGMMRENQAMLQNLIMTILGRPTPIQQSTPMNDLVTMMTALNGIHDKKDPIEMLVKGMELAKGVSGGSTDWKTELLHTAKEVVGPVVQTLAFNSQQQQQQPKLLPNNPGGVQPAPMMPNTANFLIKQGINLLKPKIMSGLDVGLAVDWVLGNANDPMYQPFISVAVNGDINTFIQLDPELANEPYKSWLENAINMLKDAYGNKGDNDGGIGNSTDTPSNEKISVGEPIISKISKVG